MGSRFSVSAGSGLVWMRLPRRASSSSPGGEGPGQKRGQTILPSNALIWGASQGVRARSGSAYRTWGACASHLVRREPWGSPGRAGAWSDSGFKTSGCLLGVDGDTWGHGGGSMEGERPVGTERWWQPEPGWPQPRGVRSGQSPEPSVSVLPTCLWGGACSGLGLGAAHSALGCRRRGRCWLCKSRVSQLWGEPYFCGGHTPLAPVLVFSLSTT